MKTFHLALVLLVAFPLNYATAQTAASPVEGAAPTTTRSLTQSHFIVARDVLQVMLAGILTEISIEGFRASTPTLRSQITNLPFYNSLPSNKQRALIAYADTFPEIGHAEAMLAAPEIIDRFAPQIAAIFSEQELRDIGIFMATPEAQSFGMRAALSGIHGEPAGDNQATDAERAMANQFAQTQGGIALVEHSDQFGQLMRDMGYALSSHPRVSSRLRRDLCDIIGEQCPSGWRAP